MASSHGTSVITSITPSSFDEERWVMHICSAFEEKEEEEVRIPVSVFCVPTPLLVAKPEAFTPHLFAIGPYHHWHPKLYEMERYKLATAKRIQRQFTGITLHHLVDYFKEHDYLIRGHYHRHLDYSEETIAWMIVIDASFLAEFLRNYSDVDDDRAFRRVPSMSHMVDSSRMRLAYHLILRDVLMLENQIPLQTIRKILHAQHASPDAADALLAKMLAEFVREVAPFHVSDTNLATIHVNNHAHILQLFYSMIVPKSKKTIEKQPTTDIESRTIYVLEVKEGDVEGGMGGASPVKRFLGHVSGLKLLKSIKPVKLLAAVPWDSFTSLTKRNGTTSTPDNSTGSAANSSDKAPVLAEETMVPSATNLIRAGVSFCPTNGDITSINFDSKTATMYLPVVSLDLNAEVLLRNLVAYETMVECGPMVFTRYTELMNGIIDTGEDVRVLRESGIIVNMMKNDEEVASLWNGMSRCVRLRKVGFIDKVLVDVNKYYNSRWSVRCRRFMKTYVLGSWQFLTFISAVLLLLLTCVEAFCEVYDCNAHIDAFTTAN